MTQEELQLKVESQDKLIKDLQDQLKALNSNATIPLDVGEAFKLRILSDAGTAATSTKGATSEDQSVNEAGASSYAVLKSPDGFLEITITNNKYYIPHYS